MSSFGAELKRERELRQIALREVAEATKINLRYLEALERNDFQHLPGGVFNRGFVRAYSQFIGVDPDAMVDAYLLEVRSQTGDEADDDRAALHASTESPAGDRPAKHASSRAAWPLWLAITVAAVVLIAGGLLVAQQLSDGRGAAPEPAGDAATASPPAPPRSGSDDPPSRPPRRTDESLDPEAEPDVKPAPPEESAPPPPVAAEADETVEPGAQQPAGGTDGTIEATLLIERATVGRLNCDNRRIEVLTGLRPGTRLQLRCESFLLVDARDGGAVHLGLGGQTPTPLAENGKPIEGYRVEPAGAGGGLGAGGAS